MRVQHRGRPARVRNLPIDKDGTTSDSSDDEDFVKRQEARRKKRRQEAAARAKGDGDGGKN